MTDHTAYRPGMYFKGIDALRFIAFLVVFLHHNTLFLGGGRALDAVTFLGRSFPVTMDLFFLISSFLIVHLAYSEYKSNGRFAPIPFLVRRGLRIYPLYFLIVFGVFAGTALASRMTHHDYFLPALWPYLLFVANYFMSGPAAFALAVLWSICVEEQFYVVLAVLMRYFFPKMKVICVLACLVFIGYKAGVVHYGWQDYGNTLNYLPDFAAGALLAINWEKWQKSISKLSAIKITILYTTILTTLICTPFLEEVPGFVYVDTIVVAALLSFIVAHQSAQNRYFQLGHLSWISRMGKRTYGLYVYHPVVMMLVLKGFPLAFPALTKVYSQTGPDLVTLVILALTLLVADLSYRYFERRILQLRDRFRPAPGNRTTTATASA